MLKKLLAISFFLLLLIQVIGYHLVFVTQKIELKKQLISILKTDAFKMESTFFELNSVFNEKAIWEGDFEFSYGGRWYDVVKFDTVNGKRFVRCFNDEKETALIEKYREVSGSDFGATVPGKTVRVLKLINLLYEESPFDINLNISASNNKAVALLIVKKLPLIYREIPKPPPVSASV